MIYVDVITSLNNLNSCIKAAIPALTLRESALLLLSFQLPSAQRLIWLSPAFRPRLICLGPALVYVRSCACLSSTAHC